MRPSTEELRDFVRNCRRGIDGCELRVVVSAVAADATAATAGTAAAATVVVAATCADVLHWLKEGDVP